MDRAKKSSPLLCAGAILMVTILATLLPLSRVQAGSDSIVVIVNASNPLSNLSVNELKQIFLADRGKWENGRGVAVVIMASGAPERTAFLKIVCGMSDGGFRKYFLEASFS